MMQITTPTTTVIMGGLDPSRWRPKLSTAPRVTIVKMSDKKDTDSEAPPPPFCHGSNTFVSKVHSETDLRAPIRLSGEVHCGPTPPTRLASEVPPTRLASKSPKKITSFDRTAPGSSHPRRDMVRNTFWEHLACCLLLLLAGCLQKPAGGEGRFLDHPPSRGAGSGYPYP